MPTACGLNMYSRRASFFTLLPSACGALRFHSHVRIMYILQIQDRFTSAYQESIRTLKDYSVDPADTVIGVWAESAIVFCSVVHNTL